jgi:hypothetical protein
VLGDVSTAFASPLTVMMTGVLASATLRITSGALALLKRGAIMFNPDTVPHRLLCEKTGRLIARSIDATMPRDAL